jgi:L-fucose mutarotase
VLAAIQSVVEIEKAEVMDPADGTTPEIFGEFTSMLGGMELSKLGRYEFYDACCKQGVRLAISTGEKRTFANLLITIGVA